MSTNYELWVDVYNKNEITVRHYKIFEKVQIVKTSLVIRLRGKKKGANTISTRFLIATIAITIHETVTLPHILCFSFSVSVFL